MSQNYYIQAKDLDFVFTHMTNAYMDKCDKCIEIHVAQFCVGLKPALQAHPEFKSWEELKRYLTKYEDKIKLYKESYGEISVENFIKEVELQNETGESRHLLFTEVRNDKRCYIDKDGYEWCEREFS